MTAINLTASQRATVYAMNVGSQDMDSVQGRLLSGKKINSASDDATKFFLASGLENTAADYGGMKDKIGIAVKTVDAAVNGLTAIKKLVEQMKGILDSVHQTSVAADRTTLRGTYNSLRAQIDSLAADATFNGKNLILDDAAANDLEVVFDPEGGSTLTIIGTQNDADGLSITSPTTWGAADTFLTSADSRVAAALTQIKTQIQTLGVNMATLKTRDEWTAKHINVLSTAASGLTGADLNEEAANLKALQMQQFFGMSNLGFSNQMQQGVLRLLG